MPNSLPDIYVHYSDGVFMLQGASQVAIALLASFWSLINGTTASVPLEAADEAFALIDKAGLRTMTF